MRIFGIVAALAAAIVARPDLAAPPILDGAGRAMLDPIRSRALAPDRLVARLRLAPDAVVADVGAGPGFLTEHLARAVPRGTVIATDVRGDYLAVLSSRMRGAGIGNVRTLRAPRDRAGLEPRSIDLALLCQVDHYLADRAGYLATLLPSLKPGGRIVLVNYARYREVDLAAARALSLQVVDEWAPSPPFFALVLARKETQ